MVTSGNFFVRQLNKNKIDKFMRKSRVYSALHRFNTRTYEKWSDLWIWIHIDRIRICPLIQLSSGSDLIKLQTHIKKDDFLKLSIHVMLNLMRKKCCGY